MSRIATKRLQKELAELQQKGPPAGCRLIQAENLEEWVFALQVHESVFAGEEFALRFRFSTSYPIDASQSPEVTFVTTAPFRPPEHPHVYTNGHICASVLGSGWSPVLNVQSLLLCIVISLFLLRWLTSSFPLECSISTIQSMLASCKKKELPPDNDRYIRNAPKSPKDTRWAYHDDTV
ncbi:ubiquitin-conjugating enzyme E2 W [Rhodotorula toruloides]|uniref:Ubiquitin-conjugating enzyme E2 W n=1 Tax=Rhodotorula toruloides TaxID=5286 RepID=A0A511KJQ1_RHOTO|nr:ubiquitin-conjugating enzyme E2 W [Rhodotorula toruloides]